MTEDRVLTVLKGKDMDAIANANSHEAARSSFDFLIISYDLLKDGQHVLDKLDFKVVVLDESHYIKSPKVCLSWNLVQVAMGAVDFEGCIGSGGVAIVCSDM